MHYANLCEKFFVKLYKVLCTTVQISQQTVAHLYHVKRQVIIHWSIQRMFRIISGKHVIVEQLAVT